MDKLNRPITQRNYLVDYLEKEKTLENKINTDTLKMQMSLMVYSTLDQIEERLKIIDQGDKDKKINGQLQLLQEFYLF